MRRLHPSLLVALIAFVMPITARAQMAAPAAPAAAPEAPAAPEVGQAAPDFTAAWADASGARATPVNLAALRGKVVVIAFYPKDRT
ncbi:MAG: redoxin domain-containing protein, partial [Gemmatimonadaceae bacterium]